jgi:hypothetical protein
MSRGQAVLAPVLLALALIVHAYAPTHSHWTVILRPTAIVLAVTVVLTLILLAIVRRPALVSAAVCMLLLIAYEWRLALLIVAVGALVFAVRRIVMHRRDSIGAAALLAPIGIFLALGVFRVVVSGTVTLDDFAIRSAPSTPNASAKPRPNVYLLLLDGYPRQDTLADDFGYDNEPFLAELETLGFRVDREARTEFAVTALSLSSMAASSPHALDRYVTDGAFGPELSAEPRQIRREQLVDGPALSALRELGYRLVYVPSPVTDVQWSGWDERPDPGQLNDFEAALLQQTPVRSMLGGWILNQARDRIADTLDTWSQPASSQQLSFAHLMAPHPPFVWDADGDVERPTDCWLANTCGLYAGFGLGMPPEEYAERMAEQVNTTNARLLAAVERLIADDPSAVIAIFSDHGTRYRSETSAEAHRTLFAARGTDVSGIDGLLVDLAAELGSGN